MIWARIRSWLRSVPARLDGTRVDEGEQLTHLGVGASFPPSDQIAQFYADNKGKPINVKPLHVKRLVEDQPDSFVKPIEVPEDDYPPLG